MKKAYRVNEYEMERGFGQRHEGTYWFSTKEKALEWVKRYNSPTIQNIVPDTYLIFIILSTAKSRGPTIKLGNYENIVFSI